MNQPEVVVKALKRAGYEIRKKRLDADKIPGGYVVRDANGQALAYVYSRESEADARQARVLTSDEARRLARDLRLMERP
jgi:hypothetical protein